MALTNDNFAVCKNRVNFEKNGVKGTVTVKQDSNPAFVFQFTTQVQVEIEFEISSEDITETYNKDSPSSITLKPLLSSIYETYDLSKSHLNDNEVFPLENTVEDVSTKVIENQTDDLTKYPNITELKENKNVPLCEFIKNQNSKKGTKNSTKKIKVSEHYASLRSQLRLKDSSIPNGSSCLLSSFYPDKKEVIKRRYNLRTCGVSKTKGKKKKSTKVKTNIRFGDSQDSDDHHREENGQSPEKSYKNEWNTDYHKGTFSFLSFLNKDSKRNNYLNTPAVLTKNKKQRTSETLNHEADKTVTEDSDLDEQYDESNENGISEHLTSCTLCGKGFENEDKLSKHWAIASPVYYFKCEHCSLKFTHLALKYYHEMRKHNPDASSGDLRNCGICNKNIKMKSLKHHLFSHTNENMYQCCFCKVKIRLNKKVFIAHLMKHKNGVYNVADWSDSRDNMQHFMRKTLLKESHKKSETTNQIIDEESDEDCIAPTPAESITCMACSNTFENQDAYEHHCNVDSGHNYSCSYCEDNFRYEAMKLYHEILHHSSEKGDFRQCTLCKRNVNYKNLRRHMFVHTGEQLYKCCSCEFQTMNKKIFHSHFKKRHADNGNENDVRRNVIKSELDELSENEDQGIDRTSGPSLITKDSITCKMCLETFENEETYGNHWNVESAQTFACDHCPLEFGREALKHYHEILHHSSEKGKISRNCSLCKQDINYKSLKGHLFAHTNENMYKCCVCDFQTRINKKLFCTHFEKHNASYDNLEDLRRKTMTPELYEIVHHDTKPSAEEISIDNPLAKLKRYSIVCRMCKVSFVSEETYGNHWNVETGDTFDCSQCSLQFSHQALKHYHELLKHTPQRGESRICHLCQKDVNVKSLKLHMFIHTNEKMYKCCICKYESRILNKKFFCTHFYRKHLQAPKDVKTTLLQIADPKAMKCSTCKIYLPDRIEFAKHKNLCTRIICHFCGGTFLNRPSINMHYDDFHHLEVFRCDKPKCYRMFSKKEEFDRHMKFHEKQKKKQCDICGGWFSVLDKHMAVHKEFSELSESQVFYCDKCPAKYKTRNAFRSHQAAEHSTDQSLACSKCPATFPNATKYRTHYYTNHAKAVHKCGVCSKSFKVRWDLKLHMRRHNRMQAEIQPVDSHPPSSILASHPSSSSSSILVSHPSSSILVSHSPSSSILVGHPSSSSIMVSHPSSSHPSIYHQQPVSNYSLDNQMGLLAGNVAPRPYQQEPSEVELYMLKSELLYN